MSSIRVLCSVLLLVGSTVTAETLPEVFGTDDVVNNETIPPSTQSSCVSSASSSWFIIEVINNMTDSQRCAVVANVVFWTWSFIGWTLDRCSWRGRTGVVDTNRSTGRSDTDTASTSARSTSTAINRWLYSQKIQSDDALTYCATNPQLGWKIFRVVAFNMIAVTPLIALGAEWLFDALYDNKYPGSSNRRRLTSVDDWRPVVEIPKLLVSFWIVSVWFYSTHRMLHWKCFYKTIHKLHHSLTAPPAMGSVYTHPVEFFIGNVAGVALGPIVTNAHPYTAYLWYGLAMTDTCRVHSGYKFLGASRHDDHHNDYFNYNFGNRAMDTLFGTQKKTE